MKNWKISSAVIAVCGLLYKQFQLLRVEPQKGPKIKQVLSTAQTQIDITLKQIRLNFGSQQATPVVDKY